MKDPKVTILIVTYNAALHIRRCLESILEHKCNALEIVIIDGKSTDSTLDIINEFAFMVNVLISEPDHGIYDAMNKGLEHIKGQWVLFMGADDRLESGFKTMVNALEDSKTSYYGMVDVKGTIYKDPYTDYRLAKLNICHQAILYSKSIFEKYTYDLKYKIWADWFLNIQSWKDPEFRFTYKPYMISKFGTEGISSMQQDTVFIRDRSKIIFKYFGLLVWFRYIFRELKKPLKR